MQQETLSGSGAALFSVKQVKAMATFISISIVQNLEAYQYVCNESPAEITANKYITVQTPLIPIATMSSQQEVLARQEIPANAHTSL